MKNKLDLREINYPLMDEYIQRKDWELGLVFTLLVVGLILLIIYG